MHRRTLLISTLALSLAGAGQAQERPRRFGRRRDPQDGASDHPRTTVAFGPHERQVYDVYADGGANAAVLIFVHGGAWAFGERTMVHALPDYVVRHGLTLVSTEYRLAPEVTAREQAEDVAAAFAQVRRTLPGRPIVLVGHSAGAHLVALVAIDAAYLAAHGLAPSDIAGVIPLDGAGYDATQPRQPGLVGRALERMYEQAFGAQRAELSPTLRVRPDIAYPPFQIFHVAGREESAEQSRRLAEALNRVGGHAEVVSAPGDSHRDINVEFGQAGDPEGERAARFIAGLR
jgi:arylformamidase